MRRCPTSSGPFASVEHALLASFLYQTMKTTVAIAIPETMTSNSATVSVFGVAVVVAVAVVVVVFSSQQQ